tara:strand:- start:37 stop:429 length:393 start_codon:yes stop_codon:yes gene_type:complete
MSQNFKKIYNINKFFDIIMKYCNNERKNEYIFSPIAYKKLIYNKQLEPFISELKEYYHKSKQFYINRELTYKNTLTIIRQILNSLYIPYTSKIIYNKSKYSINYIIYLDDEILDNYGTHVKDLSNNNVKL